MRLLEQHMYKLRQEAEEFEAVRRRKHHRRLIIGAIGAAALLVAIGHMLIVRV